MKQSHSVLANAQTMTSKPALQAAAHRQKRVHPMKCHRAPIFILLTFKPRLTFKPLTFTKLLNSNLLLISANQQQQQQHKALPAKEDRLQVPTRSKTALMT